MTLTFRSSFSCNSALLLSALCLVLATGCGSEDEGPSCAAAGHWVLTETTTGGSCLDSGQVETATLSIVETATTFDFALTAGDGTEFDCGGGSIALGTCSGSAHCTATADGIGLEANYTLAFTGSTLEGTLTGSATEGDDGCTHSASVSGSK